MSNLRRVVHVIPLAILILGAIADVADAANRPPWLGIGDVKALLPTTHKQYAKDVTLLFQQASEAENIYGPGQLYDQPGITAVDLSHVVSWQYIDKAIDFIQHKSNKKQNDLVDLIKSITQADNQAVVWIPSHASFPQFKLQPVRSIPHARLLSYDNQVLRKLNTEIRNYCLKKARKSATPSRAVLAETAKYLNSAPANLRYGVGSFNKGIGKNFDPMGNGGAVLTTKENGIANLSRKYNRNVFPWKTLHIGIKHKYQNTLIESSSVFADRCPHNSPFRANAITPMNQC